jgi:diaminohydroxyphosphoribosylaminopyrimidine deaminase/5-amino-6-(5-phosphoribosylamino)uracil reductase
VPLKSDTTFMRRALDLAARARGKTSPNPMVGAFIVRSGKIVSEGYHKRAGADHAEIVALKKAGGKARGATMYVSLEPCCHVGKTGPCTIAIINAGIRRVVYATADPDPRVSGKGARQLRNAGLSVTSGVLRRDAEQLNEQYIHSQKLKRPFVILKLAQSLDGKIASKSGDSKWISGPESRRYVHQLRTEVDAVVVGAETVRQDNPRLTVRHVKGKNPHRIIVVGKRPISSSARVITANRDKTTIMVISSSSGSNSAIVRLRKMGVEIWETNGVRSSSVDPISLVRKAHEFGFRSLLLEGGSCLATSFLKYHLVDKMILVTAPLLIGDGVNSIGDLGVFDIRQAIRFDRTTRFALGDDHIFIGYPIWRT